MKLSSLLTPELIFFQQPLTSKAGALEFLVKKSAERFGFTHRIPEIHGAVLDRESLGGTTFPSQLAVPHARIPSFNDLIIAVAVPAAPFEDQGIQVKMVTLLLTSEENPGVYLNTLSAFAKMSMKPDVFQGLLGAKTPKEFIEIVDRQNFQVKKEILVGDIMTPSDLFATADQNLTGILDLMIQNHLEFLPVLGPEGHFIGEIRTLDIINLGVPPYARMMGGVRFAASLDPFEKFLKEETRYTAAQVMKPPRLWLTPETPLLEAAARLSQEGTTCLPVLEGPQFRGTLSTMDLLSRVLRG